MSFSKPPVERTQGNGYAFNCINCDEDRAAGYDRIIVNPEKLAGEPNHGLYFHLPYGVDFFRLNYDQIFMLRELCDRILTGRIQPEKEHA